MSSDCHPCPSLLRGAEVLFCAMAFFLGWSIEAKFFFIFGCLIGIVLPFAGVIRVKKRRSPFEHALLSSANHAERGEVAQTAISAGRVSFGIQAMEEDYNVDGLWNSKTSTPLHTPLPSPAISSRDSSSIRRTLAKLSHSRRSSSSSTTSKLDFSDPQSRRSGAAQAESFKTVWARPMHLGDTQRVENFNPTPKADSDTENVQASTSNLLTPPLGPAMQHQSSPSAVHNNHLPNDENSAPYPRKTYRTLVIGGTLENANTSSVLDTPNLTHLEMLDHMEAHRRFHAAESGQLQPRTRCSSKTASVSSTYSQPVQSSHEEQPAPRAVSWPVTNNEIIKNTFVPQKKPIRQRSPHVVPFRAFVEMHPPPKTCPSAWTEKTQDRMQEKIQRTQRLSSYSVTTSKHRRTSSNNSFLTVSDTPVSSDNVSIYSQVSRKVNEGFELLPAGTLKNSTPVKTFDGANHQILIQRSNDHKQPHRLRKHDRARSRSVDSSEIKDGAIGHGDLSG